MQSASQMIQISNNKLNTNAQFVKLDGVKIQSTSLVANLGMVMMQRNDTSRKVQFDIWLFRLEHRQGDLCLISQHSGKPRNASRNGDLGRLIPVVHLIDIEHCDLGNVLSRCSSVWTSDRIHLLEGLQRAEHRYRLQWLSIAELDV